MAQWNGTSVWLVFTDKMQFKVLATREAAQAYAWRYDQQTVNIMSNRAKALVIERQVLRHGGISN